MPLSSLPTKKNTSLLSDAGILLYTHELKDARARCRYHPAPPKNKFPSVMRVYFCIPTLFFGGSGDGEDSSYLIGILLYTRILKEERERCRYHPSPPKNKFPSVMRVYFCIPTLFFGGSGDGEPHLMGILLYTRVIDGIW